MNNNTQMTHLNTAVRAIESPQIHETRIDGVQALWVEADPPLTAALMFRVGHVDETLATRGITHLVEHLVLSRLRNVTHPYNGSVTPDHTVLWASGSEADVATFLHKVSIGLSDLPLGRLVVEARVLMAEAEVRGQNVASEILAARYGPHGPGLMAYPEFGLRRLTANDVERWAAAHFTAENAVLALTGPLPDGLRLPLLRGASVPVQMPRRDNLPTEPTVVSTQEAGASVGVFGPWSHSLRVGADVVRERVEHELRHERGHVYSVSADNLAISRDESFFVWGADCAPDQAREVSEVLVECLRDVVEHGPSRDELNHVVAKALHVNLADRNTIAHLQLQHDARTALLGHVRHDIAELEPTLRALEPGDVAAALQGPFGRSMAVLAPGADVGFETRAPVLDSRIDGRAYRMKRGKDLIVLGADGVARRTDGVWTALRFDELLVVNHVAPTRRVLIDGRGEWIHLDADEWRRGVRLLTLVDYEVADAVRIPETR
jgi:hypothetical protein